MLLVDCSFELWSGLSCTVHPGCTDFIKGAYASTEVSVVTLDALAWSDTYGAA